MSRSRSRHDRRLRSAHAEPRHPGRQDRVRRAAANADRRAQRSTCAPASTGTLDSAGVVTNAGSMPTATRSKPTTSRATCCAARVGSPATTKTSPTGPPQSGPRRRALREQHPLRRAEPPDPVGRAAQQRGAGRPNATSSSRCSTKPTCSSAWTCGWSRAGPSTCRAGT